MIELGVVLLLYVSVVAIAETVTYFNRLKGA